MLAALDFSRVAWIGCSDVGVVGNNKDIVPWILNLILQDRTVETLWNWWQRILL